MAKPTTGVPRNAPASGTIPAEPSGTIGSGSAKMSST